MKRAFIALFIALTATRAFALDRFESGPEGFNTNTVWYDTGREVVAFDAQFTPEAARAAIAAIRAHTASPIRYLVITHPNPDKFNGAAEFRAAGAQVVASRATAAAIPGVHAYKKAFFIGAGMFTEATYPAQATVDVTFDDELSLPLSGGAQVLLKRLSGPGVSSTQTVALIPAERAVVVGDLVHPSVHAWLEGGIVDGHPAPDLAAWKRALAELVALGTAHGIDTVHAGRGAPAPLAASAAEQARYLDGARAVVSAYLSELGPRVSELNGPQAGAHHKELARRMAEAYPTYEHAYLIEYGVYGLAGALAAQGGQAATAAQ